jgi:hypothetical protein
VQPGQASVPRSVEAYGHLGKPIMSITLHSYPEQHRPCAFSLAVGPGSFLGSAHRDVGVALVQSQTYLSRSCMMVVTKAVGAAWGELSLPFFLPFCPPSLLACLPACSVLLAMPVCLL